MARPPVNKKTTIAGPSDVVTLPLASIASVEVKKAPGRGVNSNLLIKTASGASFLIKGGTVEDTAVLEALKAALPVTAAPEASNEVHEINL